MENTLYYTLSTIAQTLAGALAILVAVVLFRLTAFPKAIELAKDVLLSKGLDPKKYWPVMRGDGYDALVQRVKEDRQGHDIGNDTALRRDCERARTAYHHWGRINLPLYIALGFTVLDIALCFVALPYVPKINRSECGTSVILAFAVALGIICLGLYIWLIVSMVKRPAD